MQGSEEGAGSGLGPGSGLGSGVSSGTTRRSLLVAGAAALLAGAAPRPAGAQHPDGLPKGHDAFPRGRIHDQTAIPVLGFKVARVYPHDPTAYTEGLVKVGGSIFEGTGLYGQSRLMEWDLESGQVIRQVVLNASEFGEGVTVIGDTVYQLTYLSNTAFTYDRSTLTRTGSFTFGAQGWGLTQNGTHLIMSDGSSALAFRDPVTFKEVRKIYAHDAVGAVGFLNELEYVEGAVYANVWQTPYIAVIDPGTGALTAWIDLTGLNPDPARLTYPLVLNGIAWNAETRRLLVTGKCWPQVWEIDLIPFGKS